MNDKYIQQMHFLVSAHNKFISFPMVVKKKYGLMGKDFIRKRVLCGMKNVCCTKLYILVFYHSLAYPAVNLPG